MSDVKVLNNAKTLRSNQCVGWVERSDTHHFSTFAMGIATLNPSYDFCSGLSGLGLLKLTVCNMLNRLHMTSIEMRGCVVKVIRYCVSGTTKSSKRRRGLEQILATLALSPSPSPTSGRGE